MKKASYVLSFLIITLIFNRPIFGCASGEWEGIYTDYYFDPDVKSTPPFADFILESYFPDYQKPDEEDFDYNFDNEPKSSPSAAQDFIQAVESDSRLDESEKERLIATRKQYASKDESSFMSLKNKLSWTVSWSAGGYFSEHDLPKTLAAINDAINQASDENRKKDLSELKEKVEAYAKAEESAEVRSNSQAYGYDEYLQVVKAFKDHNYNKALQYVRLVKEISAPKWTDKLKFWEHKTDWLYQTAWYMEARLLLIISQQKWSGYEPDQTLDQKTLLEVQNCFDDYLKQFPQGIYAESARNLHRFIYRLEQNHKALDLALVEAFNFAYEAALKNADDRVEKEKAFESILRELARFYSGSLDYNQLDPIVIAFDVLKLNPEGRFEKLESQKDKFKPYPDFYDLVWAWSAYQNQQYEKIADRKFEEDSPTKLITQFIQARSLRVLKRYDEALALLRNHKKKDQVTDQAQAEIMCIYKEKGQGYAELFLEPVSDDVMKDILLYAIDDAQLLDWLINKRGKYPDHVLSLMASELMTRYLAQGKMQDAMKLLDSLPQNVISQYDNIRPTINVLVKNPNDMTATLQMGRYVHESVRGGKFLSAEGDYVYGEPDLALVMCERCNVCKSCESAQSHQCEFHEERHASSVYPPYYYYKKVVNHFEKTKKKSDLEAEALHFLSICGKGYSPSLQCTWGYQDEFRKEVDVKKMFQILHKKYKGSTWANETPYYY